MRRNSINSLLRKKLVLGLLLTASLVSFASLGDGGSKKGASTTPLSASARFSAKNFSLRSGYNYKGNNLLNASASRSYIMLNTPTTYEFTPNKMVVQTKKRVVILDKVKFTPGPRP